MGFSRQEHWNGLLRPSPEDLPNPGTEPGSAALQADSLPAEPPLREGDLIILKLYRKERKEATRLSPLKGWQMHCPQLPQTTLPELKAAQGRR